MHEAMTEVQPLSDPWAERYDVMLNGVRDLTDDQLQRVARFSTQLAARDIAWTEVVARKLSALLKQEPALDAITVRAEEAAVLLRICDAFMVLKQNQMWGR